jgi:ABC-type phosphate transport system substrate-binding protein
VVRHVVRVLAALGVLLALLAPPAPAADEFVVIVHPSVVGATIRRAGLAAVFLHKTRWGDGGAAAPVDQSATSAVRKAFSESVLQMPVSTVLQYWQKQMFATQPMHPPPVKGSDAEVIAFVGSTPGAVGYVAAASALTGAVKPIAVID